MAKRWYCICYRMERLSLPVSSGVYSCAMARDFLPCNGGEKIFEHWGTIEEVPEETRNGNYIYSLYTSYGLSGFIVSGNSSR